MSMQVTQLPNQGWDERLLVCRYGQLVDVFLIVTQRFVVLVDTLVNPPTAAALREIARPYLAGRSLLVVNTHADWDHAWGNQHFCGPDALDPVPVIATRRCAERLRSPAAQHQLEQFQQKAPEQYAAVRLAPPTLLFEDDLWIDGGDLTLELFATPGHQPDHCSIWIPQIRTLLAGDAAESPFPFVLNAAAFPDLRTSIARMRALDPQMVLYCHAPVTSGPALLSHNLAYFDQLEHCCRRALAQGVPVAPPDDADLEELIGFPFEAAVPPGHTVTQPEFYRPGHHTAIRAMLEYCAAT